MLEHLLFAFSVDQLNPEASLPGATQAKTLLDGLAFYALLFCVVGVVLSAGLWAVGAFSSNYTQSVNGKKGFLICAGAAIAIGAATALVTFFANLGSEVNPSGG